MSGPAPADSQPLVAYFTEVKPGAATLRLAAAVVCRGVPTPAALQGGGGLLGWLRAARHRLWLRLGPLGADVSFAGRPLFGGTRGAARSVGSVGVGLQGEPLAYYDDGSRVLRVLGRDVPAPHGGTLVALADATGARARAPHLVLRVVPTPPVPVPRFDGEPLPQGAAVTYLVGGAACGSRRARLPGRRRGAVTARTLANESLKLTTRPIHHQQVRFRVGRVAARLRR